MDKEKNRGKKLGKKTSPNSNHLWLRHSKVTPNNSHLPVSTPLCYPLLLIVGRVYDLVLTNGIWQSDGMLPQIVLC